MKDRKLIQWLLTYAKPHRKWFLFVFLLMIIGTMLDLARPIIIGQAVDLFTEGYHTPFVEVKEKNSETIFFEGKNISHQKAGNPEEKVYQILEYNNDYYWFENMTYKHSQMIEEASPQTYDSWVSQTGDVLEVSVGTKIYEGRLLSKEELGVLRSLDYKPLFGLGFLFFCVLVGSFSLVYLQAIILQKIGQKIIYRIRMDVYQKMLSLPFRYYHGNAVGKLVTRVTNDTETLNQMYTSVIINLFKHSFFIVGIIIMMLRTHMKTALYVIGLIPVVMLATFLFKHFSRKAYTDTRNRLTEMNTFLSEHLSGMRIIQVFRRESAKLQQMKGINNKLYKAGMKETYSFMVFRPFIFFLSVVGISLVLWIGGNSVLAGTMSVGALIIMVSYTKDFFGPIEQLAESFNILQAALASAEKIIDVLSEHNEIESGSTPIHKEAFKGSIEFKNVWFAYKEEEWVLKDVSFKINPGQKVAFVGATGAGKTSILSLICRYYDIQKGQILIDGKDIKSYDLDDLRKQIGQVLQDVFMFTGTVEENIRLGEHSIGEEDVKRAAKLVNADRFIDSMPNGYQSEVVEAGSTLSTGQRQLISFARAIAFNPKIFILDEATANIDTETEILIQDALSKMMDGRTTLMVAHRLSTIQNADCIIVLHKGQVRETGNHQELLAQKGLYYRLYQLASDSQVMV